MMAESKHKNYSEEQIRKAIADVEKGISVSKVANLHKIARTTLQRKLKDDGTHLATKRGPRTLFSADQENNIVMWIKTMANAGFPVAKETLMYSIEKLAKECKVTFPGGNTVPGRKWFEAFLRRHPNITLRTSQNLTTRRLDVSQQCIDKWFLEVENYLKFKKIDEVLCNPQRVFNCDENAFFLNPKPGKVLAEKGSKKIYTAAGADEKLNLTVLLTANAAGKLAPPMVVYKYTKIPQQLAEAVPADWCIGKSENGWMTQETFYEYITNIFEPYLTKQDIQRPVILFMDGHSSHLSLPLSTFCVNHGIEIVALFPNTTHLIQPMDVAVFHTLKTIWRQEVANFRMNHEGLQIQKCDFPQVLKAALERVTPETIINGFNACGLVPWDPKKVIVVKKQKSNEMAPPPLQKRHREMATFFKILEEKIGKDKLMAFEANDGEWNGPVEQSDLYNLWLETKQTLKSHFINADPHSQVALVTSVGTHANEATVFGDVSFSGPLNTCEPVAGPSNMSPTAVNRQETPVPGDDSFSGKLYTYEPVAGPSNVPSPFKRALFWPEDKNSKVKQRRRREKLPAVVTSPQMIQYFKKKEEVKKSIETLKEKRKIEREERKKAAEEKKMKKRKTRVPSPVSSSSENYSSDEVDEWQSLLSETESEDEGDPIILEKPSLHEGQFVLVSILGGKRNTQKYIYLCVIQEMKDNIICVQGLRSTGNKKDFKRK